MSVFSRFFGFIAFSGVSQRWELKNTTIFFYKKNRVEKFLQKIDQKPKTDLFAFFYHVFGRFSVRGVKKHGKKIDKINLTLVLFWPLTHPPTTGLTDFFLAAPCPPPFFRRIHSLPVLPNRGAV
jgi:hypothetical protein